MSSVSLLNVTKSFGPAVRALDDVSLDVMSGEFIALLGSSGCGKTTLLRSVAGLETPTQGKILINGRDITPMPTRNRPIGMVFQSYALFPNMTVRQNVAFPLMTRKKVIRRVDERVNELLELVQLTTQADRYPNQLSGGQQQRASLARALSASPEVLLLDEPLSALDALVRNQLREEIRRIQQSLKITTLFVTHDQSEAMAIADRVAVMSHGKIEQIASPLELYETPSTRFSASFIGNRNALELPVQEGRVRLGGALDVPAPDINGNNAIVFFRPEDVEFSNNGIGHPATVEGKIFQGALTRLHLHVKADHQAGRFYADLPSRQAATLDMGSTVRVYVKSENACVFSAEH